MSEEDFKPHMMYHPESGDGVMADTYEKHLKLAGEGYTHEPPSEDMHGLAQESECGCDHDSGESCEECEVDYDQDDDADFMQDVDAAEVSGGVKDGLKKKVDEHNKKASGETKKTTLKTLVAVFKRGVGAYKTNPSSVRPNVKSPEQWAYARVNSFLRALKSGKFGSGKHDTDLFPKGHPLSSKGEKKMSASYKPVEISFDSTANLDILAYHHEDEEGGESIKAFDINAYNGGSLSLQNFSEPAYIDLSSAYVHGEADQQPILMEHDTKKIVGHGKPMIHASDMTVESGVMSHDNEHSRQIVAAAKNGFQWQASVGGKMTKPPLMVKEGQSARVNGRSVSGPAVVIRGFMWRETSFCGIGCDNERASARVAASLDANTVRVIDMDFNEWLEARGFSAEDLNEKQLSSLQASFDSENAPAPEVSDEVVASVEKQVERINPEVAAAEDTAKYIESVRSARRAEDARVSELEGVYDEYKSMVPKAVLASLFDSALAGELDRNKFELECIKEARQPRDTPAIHRGYARKSYDVAVVEASLLRSGGMGEDAVAASVRREHGSSKVEEIMNKSYDRNMQGFGLQDLVYASIESAGEEVPSRRCNAEVIECAMRASREIKASNGSSTLSLPGVLSNIANKQMLQSYEDNKGIWEKICSTTDTSDFKSFDSYRLTEAGVLEQVGPAGEIKHTSLGEESFSNRVVNHARLIGLTEEMLMNDDLGAFQRLARHFGRMSAHAIEQSVINTLNSASVNAGAGSSSDFFRGAALDNMQANYFEGATSALSIDSLGEAWQLFADQTDSQGKPIMLSPSVLLTSTKNAILSKQLYNSTEVRISGTTDRTRAVSNQWAGMFEPVMSQYLGQTAMGGDEDAWYLVSQVSDDFAPIQVAFLSGQRTPQIERFDYDPNMLGVTFRAKLPFGVALQDARCIVKSKGKA